MARVDEASFRCLGFSFRFSTNNEALAAYLDDLYAACRVDEPGAVCFSVRVDDEIGRIDICVDADHVLTTSSPSIALARLVWEINHSVATSTGDRLLLHAGAVEYEGVGILLPAAQDSGKSTLVAALVADGFSYLTDELAAFDDATGLAYGAAKPITLEPGSWPVLPTLAPDVPPDLEPFLGLAWQIAPLRIRPDAVVEHCRPILVVTPRYERGARTRLTRKSRAETALLLAQQSFNFDVVGPRALRAVAALVRNAECYELVLGDATAACALLRRLCAESTASVA